MPIFTITGFHQNGREISKQNPNNVRIVCETQEGVTIAIWGSVKVNTANIDLVENMARQGFPVKIDCDTNKKSPPNDFQNRYGHSEWIGENNRLEIVR